jgi:CrcB protein
MNKLMLLAGSGGFIGAALRFIINSAISRHYSYISFPISTALINIFGCGCIGFINAYLVHHNINAPHFRLFTLVGILGGFTTFSAFGLETYGLLQNEQFGAFASNILLNVVIGLVAVYLGTLLGKIT